MHLLKNFGTGGGAANLKAGPSATTGAKSSYFSSLNLAAQKQKQTAKNPKVSKKTQGPPKGFIPEKFALDFDKPAIILEYRDPENDKLYHHRMPMKKLRKDTPAKVALEYIKKKHYHYFMPKVIDQVQVEKLIDRLKNGLIGDINEEMSNVDEEEFDFDYEDDFDV